MSKLGFHVTSPENAWSAGMLFSPSLRTPTKVECREGKVGGHALKGSGDLVTLSNVPLVFRNPQLQSRNEEILATGYTRQILGCSVCIAQATACPSKPALKTLSTAKGQGFPTQSGRTPVMFPSDWHSYLSAQL